MLYQFRGRIHAVVALSIAVAFCSIVHEPALAQDRSSCIGLRQKATGGQELYNSCVDTVTVFWCQDQGGIACSQYENMLFSFSSGSSYSVGRGYTRWGACKGINSRAATKGLQYSCKNE